MSLFTEQRRHCGCPIYVWNADIHKNTHSQSQSCSYHHSFTLYLLSLSLSLHTSLSPHTQKLADLNRYMVNLSLKGRHLIHQKKESIEEYSPLYQCPINLLVD